MTASDPAEVVKNLKSELARMRAALAEAEQSRHHIENILSVLPAAVYTCDAEGRITYFNGHAAKLWGRAPRLNDDSEKFCGSFRLWSPDGAEIPAGETPMAGVLTTGEAVRHREVTIERPDGSRVVVRVNIDPLIDAEGRRCGAINVFRDVTEHSNAEEASRRLAAIVESSDDAIISKDLNGIIKTWNQAAEKLFGYTAEEAVGRSITILIPPERHDEEPGIVERIRRGERIDHYETVRITKDGRLLDISLTVSPIKDAEGKVIGASKIARDITQRKATEAALREATQALAKANEELEMRVKERTAKLEQANAALRREMQEELRLQAQLRQAQKLESMGTLAGGIAHDFNNLLNIIKGYAALIGHQCSTPEQIPESLSVIHETVDRGAQVVRQLLTLSRRTESKLAITNANDVVSDLSRLLGETLPKTIEIVLNLDANLPLMWADPHQMNQALLNLALNSRDAMPLGGVLSVRTGTVASNEISHHRPKADQYICVAVSDSGTGIVPEIRERIFEPFFTTKGISEGTGLGLAMVYAIVNNHKGYIDVESEPGRGTTFRLYFPVADSGQPPQAELLRGKQSSASGVHGDATILVVEDEKAMVGLLRGFLRRSGFNVLVAVDGQQAIELYRRHKHSVDLVLLDLGLPKVAGWDVIAAMRHENPELNVIVASGYIEPAFKSKMTRAGVKTFIEKPYVQEDLLQLINESLSQKAAVHDAVKSTAEI